MTDADRERIDALRRGAEGKSAGYVSIDVTDFRWLVTLATRELERVDKLRSPEPAESRPRAFVGREREADD